jgi:dTDP-4-dehydrorhamnose 3,5-epimerase
MSNILVTHLLKIPNKDGDIYHGISRIEDGYVGFGEAYFSSILPGAIKAWKRHIRMTMNLIVPIGRVKFVFFNPTKVGKDKFDVIEIGEKNYSRITVPPMIWFGFQGLDPSSSLVLNIANIQHDPNEVERKGQLEFDYKWS